MKSRAGTFCLLKMAAYLSILLVWSTVAIGQMSTRAILGTVTDRHHEPLRGVVVQAENGVTEAVVSYITNRDGKYSFKRLDVRTDYRIWATFRGKKSKILRLSQFDSNRPRVIDFVLSLN
jgi:hypothetical protein